MTGAASRRRGHDAERAVTRWLKDHGYPDAYTTRSRLGHDGAHAPGDVVGPVGLVIEVKDVTSSAWPTWCKQAEFEAGDRSWVVVRRTRGVPDVGLWLCRYGGNIWPVYPLSVPFAGFLAWWLTDDVFSSTLAGDRIKYKRGVT